MRKKCYKITRKNVTSIKNVTKMLQNCAEKCYNKPKCYKNVQKVFHKCYVDSWTQSEKCYKSVTKVLQKCYGNAWTQAVNATNMPVHRCTQMSGSWHSSTPVYRNVRILTFVNTGVQKCQDPDISAHRCTGMSGSWHFCTPVYRNVRILTFLYTGV